MCLCNLGFTGSNSAGCASCAAGKFKPSTGADACTNCPANHYSGWPIPILGAIPRRCFFDHAEFDWDLRHVVTKLWTYPSVGIGRQHIYRCTDRPRHEWTRVVFAVLTPLIEPTLVAVSVFVRAGIRSIIPPWVG
jgi:hypothetical protein